MQPSPDFISSVIPFLSVLGAVGGLAAGLVKFAAWLKDRRLTAQLDSAKYFQEKGVHDWQRSLGQAELDRINFARLTDIDVSNGHKAIFRLHARMGGRRADWDLIDKAKRFIRRDGAVARVRKLRRKDKIHAGIALVAAAASALAAATLVFVILELSRRHSGASTPLIHAFWIAMVGIYATACSFGTWFFLEHFIRYGHASRIRKDFLLPRFKRMTAHIAARSTTAGAAEYSAQDRARPSNS